MGLFDKLKSGLAKTKNNFVEKIDRTFAAFGKVDDELFDELEETLVLADIGMSTTEVILSKLRSNVASKRLIKPDEVKTELISIITELLDVETESVYNIRSTPKVILVIGVNGVGKTTTIGKIAHRFIDDGKKVTLAAGDTFRAAAIEQLDMWAKRAGANIVKHQDGADPSAVVFDALDSAIARNHDVVICDTAGRLHNKKGLMQELAKINRIIDSKAPEADKEVLLVLDSTTGQNAVNQAEAFSEVTGLTGIVLTKLDGTAKGGIIISIVNQMNIPIKLIGVGEGMEDLQEFNGAEFARALFEE